MATKSLADINIQIQELQQQAAELQRQADELRNHERATVIAQITEKIAEYSLTAADLRLSVRDMASPGKKAATSKGTTKAPAKYRSATGEEWSGGRGRKPRWVTEALAAGKSIEEFKIR